MCALVWLLFLCGPVMSWDYNNGDWGGVCSTGKAQSPIDIAHGKLKSVRAPELQFHDYDARGSITDLKNGHTEMVRGFKSWTRQPSISGGGLGARYVLQQFHFHWDVEEGVDGSEHTIDGKSFPLELHLVHVREDLDEDNAGLVPNGIAVVAVLFEKSGHKDGTPLFELAAVLAGNRFFKNGTTSSWYSPKSLLPRDTTVFYRYNGSLTTPPCSETVIWTVLRETNYVTEHQLETMRKYFSREKSFINKNHRPVQPLNGRKVYKVFALGYFHGHLDELVQPNGDTSDKLWQEGRRESSHEVMLADMLTVYRQNCDLRENVNRLLQMLQEKDAEISQLRSIKVEHSATNEGSTPSQSDAVFLENEQLKAANENIIRRYNEMDNLVMELEEKSRGLEVMNRELEERLRQLQIARHYDEPCNVEDRPLPQNELARLPYFHGKIGRRAAESLLEFHPEGDFLIRNCDMSLSDYTLSVRARDGIRHFLVRSTENKVFLGVNSFTGWIHLVEFHRHKSLLNTNYRRLTLISPVNK